MGSKGVAKTFSASDRALDPAASIDIDFDLTGLSDALDEDSVRARPLQDVEVEMSRSLFVLGDRILSTST